MTGPMWRVSDLVPHTPAHVVRPREDGRVVTSCGWEPSVRGRLITHSQMLALPAFVCRACVRTVRR